MITSSGGCLDSSRGSCLYSLRARGCLRGFGGGGAHEARASLGLDAGGGCCGGTRAAGASGCAGRLGGDLNGVRPCLAVEGLFETLVGGLGDTTRPDESAKLVAQVGGDGGVVGAVIDGDLSRGVGQDDETVDGYLGLGKGGDRQA